MGRIYQRRAGGNYYGYWLDTRGQENRRTLRTRDATVARARLRELELAATNPAAYSRITLSTAITAMLDVVSQENADGTHRSYAQKGRHLVRVIGDVELRSIDRDGVVTYIKVRKAETASNHTIHKELVVLRRALKEASERKWWSGDPRSLIPTIKVEYTPRETWLTDHQAQQMLPHVSLTHRRRLWVQIGIYGGLCKGEIERLRWEHINFAEMQMRVPGTKRKSRWRLIPLFPELAYAMEPYRQKAGLVVGRWHNCIRALARACELARVPRVTPNDLRRTCASWLKNNGIDSATVAAILGNTTAMIDRVYGKISMETMQAAIARLPKPDRCAAGVRDTGDETGIPEIWDDLGKRRNAATAEGFRVPRVGIEPTTRGFSVRNLSSGRGGLRRR